MAGSLNHIVGNDGHFTMDTIENMGDAHEALHECFEIIRSMSAGDCDMVNDCCFSLGYHSIGRDMKPSPLDTEGGY